jgi:transcriptional regulator with PAS, ATPase and Fis domain
LRRWHCSAGNGDSAGEIKLKLGLEQFVGESQALVAAIRQIPKLARCDASVFITGETGTGKEMFARAIHYLSPRAGKPFIPVNCGAIPADLVENELFGHDAGAFTGATLTTRGLIHDADGGTLFLDEIDSLPLPSQVKLLRFLQDKIYRPLGSRKMCQADIRVIAASNANVEDAVRSGGFRSDLFYRINVLPLALPPLRDRKEDIVLLARHFTATRARELNSPAKELSQAALQKLVCYNWPGNVRELENIIQRAVVLAEQPLIQSGDIILPGATRRPNTESFKDLKAQMILHFERTYLQRLLTTHEGNITRAAKAANKNRRAFWQLLRKHKLQFHRPPSEVSPSRADDRSRLDKVWLR